MIKGLKSVNLKIIQMYHFRLKWKRYTVCTNWWDSQLFLSGTPTFSSWTPTFCQMGVLNSCFQNPSESSEVHIYIGTWTFSLMGNIIKLCMKTVLNTSTVKPRLFEVQGTTGILSNNW